MRRTGCKQRTAGRGDREHVTARQKTRSSPLWSERDGFICREFAHRDDLLDSRAHGGECVTVSFDDLGGWRLRANVEECSHGERVGFAAIAAT